MSEKTCTKCEQSQPLASFYKDKSRPDGLRTWCKSCAKAHIRQYAQDNRESINASMRAWREKNHEHHRAYMRDLYAQNVEKRNAYDRERWGKRREKVNAQKRAVSGERREIIKEQNRKVYHKYHLLRWYGITVEQYWEMFDSQGGICAICQSPPSKKRRLAVDHCHTSGKIRGLLCHNCNSAIGLLQESPDLIATAHEYLQYHA